MRKYEILLVITSIILCIHIQIYQHIEGHHNMKVIYYIYLFRFNMGQEIEK